MNRFHPLLCVAVAVAAIAGAQVKVGDRAPRIAAEKLGNTTLTSLAQLRGKAVLYEYFAFW